MTLTRSHLLILSFLFLFVQCSTSDDSTDEPDPDNTQNEEPSPDEPVEEIELATIETVEASEITTNSAISGGIITDDGGAEITARGICWSLETEPILEDEYTEEGLGLGSFESDIVNLKQGTTYYTRAYATNSEGTAYGNEVSFTTTALPDKIYEGDLLLSTQAEIDDFGIQEYTEVNGILTVQENTPNEILNLEGLENLRRVTGDLEILFNEEINSLNGLRNLQAISGILKIWGTTKLPSLEGLSSLVAADELNIQGNPELTDISALSGITELSSGSLVIFLNNSLESLNGLHNITSVGGGVSITYNDNLLDLDGLSSLQTIGAVLGISRNSNLTNIDGLAELQSVELNFEIFENDALASLDGINNLTECGSLDINDNVALISINGFNSLTTVNRVSGINIDSNPALTQINGFGGLNSISSSLKITTNTSLEEINGFNTLEMIGTDLEVNWNISLETLDTFNQLTDIGRDLSISSNSNLIRLSGFEKLNQLNSLNVQFNSSLADLCGLTNIIDSGFTGSYNVSGNAYDPTLTELQMGDCAQ